MSALPKRDNQQFWMEAKVAEIPFPQVPLATSAPSIAIPKQKAPERREKILFPDLTPALRFERAISIALIVFGLMTLSAISFQSLSAKFNTRDTRLAIQDTRGEIGRYRAEIQAVKSEMSDFTASPESIFLPIDPSDVAIVTLPLGNR